MRYRGFPPKLYLVGAQKAGTTQLADYLSQHPDICLANPKEPGFYAGRWGEQDFTWYLNCFNDPERILLDASTSYSCAPLPNYFESDKDRQSAYSGVPERIHGVAPDAIFIYIMRDPARRAYSAYLHQVRAGLESRSFCEALAGDSYYLRTSHYVGQLQLYLEYFPIERFKFVFFEEFIADPCSTVRECFNFMGVDSNVPLHSDVGRNESFVYSGIWSRVNSAMSSHGGLNRVAKWLKPRIPPVWVRLLANWAMKSPPPPAGNEIAALQRFFLEHDEMLCKLLSINSLPWRNDV